MNNDISKMFRDIERDIKKEITKTNKNLKRHPIVVQGKDPFAIRDSSWPIRQSPSIFSLIEGNPNSNVIFELGYAVAKHGWNQVVCVNNNKFGKPEELPFDIRGHRITNYHSDSENAKSNLEQSLQRTIESLFSKTSIRE